MAVCVCVTTSVLQSGTAARAGVPQLRGQQQVSHLSNARVNAANACKRSRAGVRERGLEGWMIEQRRRRGVKHRGVELSQFSELQFDG